jgi:hypothetical protein
MLFRRVAEHVRQQNWFAVGIDFAIVVLGVFVGIQVSNWNGERIERHQERELLVRLYEDFVESINGQQRDLAFLDQQFSDQTVILRSLTDCKVAPEDFLAFQRGIVTLGYINPPRLFRRTIDELASAGKMDLIQDKEIRDELASIVAMAEWRRDAYDGTARTTEHYRFIVEEKVHYDLTETHTDGFLGEFFGIGFDMQSLCEEPLIASAVSAISQATEERGRAYRAILVEYQEFLPLLQQELQERWQMEISEAAP